MSNSKQSVQVYCASLHCALVQWQCQITFMPGLLKKNLYGNYFYFATWVPLGEHRFIEKRSTMCIYRNALPHNIIS